MSFSGYIVTYQDKGLILDLSHGSPTPGTAAIIQTPNPPTLNQQVSAVLYLAVSRNLKLIAFSGGSSLSQQAITCTLFRMFKLLHTPL
jgi:hypothetical protein